MQLIHVNMRDHYVDMTLKSHVNTIISYIDIFKLNSNKTMLHVHIIMLQGDTIYLSCREQQKATILMRSINTP